MAASVTARVVETLRDRFGVPAATVTPDTTLDALDFDLLALTELAEVLSQDLRVRVASEELSLWHTVGEVAALLSRKGATRGPAE